MLIGNTGCSHSPPSVASPFCELWTVGWGQGTGKPGLEQRVLLTAPAQMPPRGGDPQPGRYTRECSESPNPNGPCALGVVLRKDPV